jgi:dATP pyrophosphohydrolase
LVATEQFVGRERWERVSQLDSSGEGALMRAAASTPALGVSWLQSNMSRELFQVLVIPYQVDANGQPQYLLFKRSDLDVWQWIAGGGEDDEKPEQTARREALEEAGIPEDTHLIRLDSRASIPAIHFADHHLWGTDVYVIPEYSFSIEVKNEEVRLSHEHSESAWLDYETARSRLEWDSNKIALWELHSRLSARHAEQVGREAKQLSS